MPKLAYLDLYVAYGSAALGAVVRGRLLAGKRPEHLPPESSRVARLLSTAQQLETDEIGSAPIEVALVSATGEEIAEYQATTDEEGYFAVRAPGPLAEGALRVRARLMQGSAPPGHRDKWLSWECDSAESAVLIYGETPGLAVISDIDDTVLDTSVTDKIKLVSGVLLGTPGQMRTFDGAASLYQRFAKARMPIVFVSGSPWSLEPRLRAFLKLKGFPQAAFLLKDLGIGASADSVFQQDVYKAKRIAEVMNELPTRRFILIGDSGERDPEIYDRALREYPGRIAAALIRRVPHGPAQKGAAERDAQRFAKLNGVKVCDSFAEITAALVNGKLLAPA